MSTILKLSVLDPKWNATGRHVDLNGDVFSVGSNKHVIYLYVKYYLANQRQGNHSTKNRAIKTGSTRKLYKQKGTGRARVGDKKSPLLKGGAVAHGPVPRFYKSKLNKKVINLAMRCALSMKNEGDQIRIVEDNYFLFNSYNTKNLKDSLNFFKNKEKLKKNKVLLITKAKKDKLSDLEDNYLYLSSRNLPFCRVKTSTEVNCYDVLQSDFIIFSEDSLSSLEERLLVRVGKNKQ